MEGRGNQLSPWGRGLIGPKGAGRWFRWGVKGRGRQLGPWRGQRVNPSSINMHGRLRTQAHTQGLHAAPHPPTGFCPPLPAYNLGTHRCPHTLPTCVHLRVDSKTHVRTLMDNGYMHTHTAPTNTCPLTPRAHMLWGLGEPCTSIGSNLELRELTKPHTSPYRHPATSLSPTASGAWLPLCRLSGGEGLGRRLHCWRQGQVRGPSHRAGKPAPELSSAPACRPCPMTLANALLSQPQFPHFGASPGTNTL